MLDVLSRDVHSIAVVTFLPVQRNAKGSHDAGQLPDRAPVRRLPVLAADMLGADRSRCGRDGY